MRIIICDDDPIFVKDLEAHISNYFNKIDINSVEIITYNNGISLLNDTLDKDIVFLDIEMPGMSGVNVGKELKSENKDVIIFITTSHTEYLDDAMRFNVFRYLTKPLDIKRLNRNLKEALELYFTSTNKVSIETKDMTYIIPLSEIIYIESEEHSSFVQTTKTQFHCVYKVSDWVSILNANLFFQSHRSYIVNLSYVYSYNHTMIHLYNNQYCAYLTRRKYCEFKTAYMLYLESIR